MTVTSCAFLAVQINMEIIYRYIIYRLYAPVNNGDLK